MNHRQRVVIIGGGITGLAAAYRLTELNQKRANKFEVVLFEAGPRLGGIIQTEERDGFLLEHGPDSFISEKPAALELAQRLGLESRLIQTNSEHRRSFIVRKGRLVRVPEGFHLLAPSRFWPFWRSEIFSLQGKARMMMDLLLPRRAIDGSADESLASFVRRRLGREALERMAQPMVGGIYTADPEQLSLRATFPRFLQMEREHGSAIRGLRSRRGSDDASGARYSLFLSFDRGMQVLSDELATKLDAEVQLNRSVRGLRQTSEGQWTIELEDVEAITADAVCVTLPAHAAADILQQCSASLATELSAIPYESTATMNLAFQRSDIAHPLDGFGFVVPFVEQRSLIACTFSSVKFAARAPKGAVLLRAFVGGALQPEMFALEGQEMVRRVLKDLSELLGVTGEPLFTTVTKWRDSMPQYHVGHLDRVRQIQAHAAQLRGLSIAGGAYFGVGIPDCVRSGEDAAERLVSVLSS